jgi:hypothetical protein
VALQPLIRPRRSVGQHGRLSRRAQPRSELNRRPGSGAARSSHRAAERPAHRRRSDRHRFGAPIAAPQSRGRAPAASGSPGCRDRASASEASTDASESRFRRAPAGGEASPRSTQEAAALRRHRRVKRKVSRGLTVPRAPIRSNDSGSRSPILQGHAIAPGVILADILSRLGLPLDVPSRESPLLADRQNLRLFGRSQVGARESERCGGRHGAFLPAGSWPEGFRMSAG